MLQQAAAKAHQCYRRAVLCVERAQDAGDELSRNDWLDQARFWVAVAKSYTIPGPVE